MAEVLAIASPHRLVVKDFAGVVWHAVWPVFAVFVLFPFVVAVVVDGFLVVLVIGEAERIYG